VLPPQRFPQLEQAVARFAAGCDAVPVLGVQVNDIAWDPRALSGRMAPGSVVVLAAAALFGLLFPGPAVAAGPVVLVAAALLGLPHGAVDHLAVGWVSGGRARAHPAFLLGYGLAALGAAILAVAYPAPAVLVLLVLSIAHFAEGESSFDRLRGGAGRLLPGLAVGTCVVANPLLLRPSEARPLLASLDPGLPDLVATFRLPVLAVAALLALGALLSAVRSGSRAAGWELALVVLATVLAPALLVFGAWFAGWHAPRHLLRLMALQPAGDGRARARVLLRGAAGPTVVAVAGLTGLVVVLGGLSSGILVALLALTVPHAAVVAWLGQLPRVTCA
jgi:Brp/Blh family beta-carotene 15,15'-monooxygenase